jgi:hypothetical protein
MKQVPAEQIQATVQVLLTFLDSDGISVPGNMLEGVVSGKSILRGLLNGGLVLAQVGVPDIPDDGDAAMDVDDEKAA